MCPQVKTISHCRVNHHSCPKTRFSSHRGHTAVIQENFANSTDVVFSERSAIWHVITGHFNLHTTSFCCAKTNCVFFSNKVIMVSLPWNGVWSSVRLLWGLCSSIPLYSSNQYSRVRQLHLAEGWLPVALILSRRSCNTVDDRLQTRVLLIRSVSLIKHLAVRSDVVCMKWHTWAWRVRYVWRCRSFSPGASEVWSEKYFG